MHMIRKGQVRWLAKGDVLGQRVWFSGILQRHFRGCLTPSRFPIHRSREGLDCMYRGRSGR
jgi:hypothetical protein